VLLHHPRGGARLLSWLEWDLLGLPGGRQTRQLLPHIFEVRWRDAQLQHFFNHRPENRPASESSLMAEHWQAASDGGPRPGPTRFDHTDGQATFIELCGEHPVRPAAGSRCAGRSTIRLQDLANVFLLAQGSSTMHPSTLQFPQRRTLNVHRVAIVSQPAQERLYHRPAAFSNRRMILKVSSVSNTG